MGATITEVDVVMDEYMATHGKLPVGLMMASSVMAALCNELHNERNEALVTPDGLLYRGARVYTSTEPSWPIVAFGKR